MAQGISIHGIHYDDTTPLGEIPIYGKSSKEDPIILEIGWMGKPSQLATKPLSQIPSIPSFSAYPGFEGSAIPPETVKTEPSSLQRVSFGGQMLEHHNLPSIPQQSSLSSSSSSSSSSFVNRNVQKCFGSTVSSTSSSSTSSSSSSSNKRKSERKTPMRSNKKQRLLMRDKNGNPLSQVCYSTIVF